MWGTPWPGSLCLKKCCLGKSDWQLGHKMANHGPNWPWPEPLVMRFQGPIHPKQKIEFAENRLTWCETNSQAPNAIKSLQIVMLSQQVVSCQEAPIMIYKQGAHTTMVCFLLKYPLTKASYYCYFEWGGRNDVINKRKCKCFFSPFFQWCIVGHLTASVFEMNETSEPEIFLHQSPWLIDHWLWNRARFEIPCTQVGAVLQKISEHQSCRGLFNSPDARSALRCQRADLVRCGKQEENISRFPGLRLNVVG